MDTYGIKTSKTNKDASSVPYKDLAFSSDFPLLKIFKQGILDFTGATTKQVRHGLGYAPAFIVTGYGPSGTNSTQRNLFDYENTGGETLTAYSDNTDLTIVYGSTNAGRVFYYIFIDPVK